MNYTVVGQYDFSSETGDDSFVEHVAAHNAHEAAQVAVNQLGSPATVIAVFAGHHTDLTGTIAGLAPQGEED